jgi:hypothetical protein
MYRLRWLKSVSRDLLHATAIADSQVADRILLVMGEVESILANDPETAGKSREPGTRFLIVSPLSITYKLNAKERIVKIVRATVHST